MAASGIGFASFACGFFLVVRGGALASTSNTLSDAMQGQPREQAVINRLS